MEHVVHDRRAVPVTLVFLASLVSPFPGPIPCELGMLSWLERLDLSENRLTGEKNKIAMTIANMIANMIANSKTLGSSK